MNLSFLSGDLPFVIESSRFQCRQMANEKSQIVNDRWVSAGLTAAPFRADLPFLVGGNTSPYLGIRLLQRLALGRATELIFVEGTLSLFRGFFISRRLRACKSWHDRISWFGDEYRISNKEFRAAEVR